MTATGILFIIAGLNGATLLVAIFASIEIFRYKRDKK